LDFTEKAVQQAPRFAIVGRWVDIEAPSDGVGVVDDKVDALHRDRREEDIPCLSCDDVWSEGVAMGLDILGDLVVALDGSAEEIPHDIRSGERVARYLRQVY
jgi:hypothetical protein